MVDYCDTNILTAFVNRNEIRRNFGKETERRFMQGISRYTDPSTIIKAKQVTSCLINGDALLSDLVNHAPSMAGALTSIGIRNIQISKINGENEGIDAYRKACLRLSKSETDKNSEFYRKFCKDGRLKDKSELGRNNLNDIRHIGSAIKIGADRFITGNRKDFKPLKSYLKKINIV